jgi:dephospho-CoA kinase
MQKLKKSLKRNSKPKFILIYGPIGAGKLTVAKELQKLTGFPVVHNHMILNLVEELFPRGANNPYRANLIIKIFKIIIKEAAQKRRSIIMTHPYAHSFVYKNGVSDPVFVKSMIKTFQDNNGLGYPVHIVCDKKENLKRASNKERKIHKKLIDKKTLKEIFDREDHFTSPVLKNNFKIDTTNLEANKVAETIKNYFNL